MFSVYRCHKSAVIDNHNGGAFALDSRMFGFWARGQMFRRIITCKCKNQMANIFRGDRAIALQILEDLCFRVSFFFI